MHIPAAEEFVQGYQQYEDHEKRDSMYKVATFLVNHFWGRPIDMADGLGVLLLTWNQAFYRYGIFSFDKLERCITENLPLIESFRQRDILTLSSSDNDGITHLFLAFLEALKIQEGKNRGRRSPVAVAKALHLLASAFFPIWDEKIAKQYGCAYNRAPAEKYLDFCRITRNLASQLRAYSTRTDRSLIKLIDEYNYSKYTQGWI